MTDLLTQYRVVFPIIFLIGFKIWGVSVIDDIFIFIISLVAYKLVGYFLHVIGFWPKWEWFNF